MSQLQRRPKDPKSSFRAALALLTPEVRGGLEILRGTLEIKAWILWALALVFELVNVPGFEGLDHSGAVLLVALVLAGLRRNPLRFPGRIKNDGKV